MRIKREGCLQVIMRNRSNRGNVQANTLPYRPRNVVDSNRFGGCINSSVHTINFRGLLALFQYDSRCLEVIYLRGASALFQFLACGRAAQVFRPNARRHASSYESNSGRRRHVFKHGFQSANDPGTDNRSITRRGYLLIHRSIKGAIRSLIDVQCPRMFHLSPVSATARYPSSIKILAVICVSILARGAFPARNLRISHRPIAQLRNDSLHSCLFRSTRRLVPRHGAQCDAQRATILSIWVTNTSASRHSTRRNIFQIFRFKRELLCR